MTNDQINRAIAETCGWEEITDSVAPEEFQRRASGMLRDKHNNRTPLKQIPNYVHDLNAMHEAEKVLGEKRIRTYAFLLAQVLDTSPTVDLDGQFLNIHASARQRAEAFLRTLGKWEEVQP